MTGNALAWMGGFCALWIGIGYYLLFIRGAKKQSLVPVNLVPKPDSEVIVFKTKIMINILFAEEERVQATPAVLADFVISFKDIVNGTYKPNNVGDFTAPVTVSDVVAGVPDKKGPPEEKGEDTPDQEGLPDQEIPDLSDEPELPEIDTENIPEREEDSNLVFDESQLVDSNSLNLNMLNF